MIPQDLAAGTMVGEYIVDRLIGEGSFGKVYAATHPVIGKAAAVKVLGIEHAAKPQFVSRFVEEARAVNRIGHRGIVDIFAFGQLPDGRHYFVMELLVGMTLTDFIKQRGRVSVAEALPILRDIGRALDAAHNAGIAHRDLKPDNIFLTFEADGSCYPKLLDFGIAKLMGDTPMGGHRTATGTPMGTPLYMSPEQCKGQSVDHRTDIYAFGVVVHEMLTGRRPFDHDNVMEVMMAHMSKDAPPMSSMAGDIPHALDPIVQGFMAKDPAARPATVGTAVDGLVEAARAAGIAVRSTGGESGASQAHPPGPHAGMAVAPTEHAAQQSFISAQRQSAQQHSAQQHSAQQQSAHGYPPAPQPHLDNTHPSALAAHHAPPPMAYPMAPPPPHGTFQPAARTLESPSASTGTKIALFIGGGCAAIVIVFALILLLVALADDDDDTTTPETDSAEDENATRFRHAVPERGMTADTTSSVQIQLEVTRAGQRAAVHHLTHSRASYEVVESNDARVTRARVHIVEAAEINKLNDSEQRQPKLSSGKRYLIYAKGDDLEIRRDPGVTVVGAERDAVYQEVDAFMGPNVLRPLFDKKALAVGTKTDVDPKTAREWLGESDVPISVSRMRLELRGFDQQQGHRVATFDVSMALRIDGPEMRATSELSGIMELYVKSMWLKKLTLNGPLNVDTDQAQVAPGTMTIAVDARYKANQRY
jgi:serine/threonine protein kinase